MHASGAINYILSTYCAARNCGDDEGSKNAANRILPRGKCEAKRKRDGSKHEADHKQRGSKQQADRKQTESKQQAKRKQTGSKKKAPSNHAGCCLLFALALDNIENPLVAALDLLVGQSVEAVVVLAPI